MPIVTGTYEAFDRAFALVSAYAILKDGHAVGRIAIKWPKDGMGRATFYLQVWGVEMVKGAASGCGYDKATAAAHKAGVALAERAAAERANCEATGRIYNPESLNVAEAFGLALAGDSDGGWGWKHRLESAGFAVANVLD